MHDIIIFTERHLDGVISYNGHTLTSGVETASELVIRRVSWSLTQIN